MKQLTTMIALVILLPQITLARDLGVHGSTFEVKEEGFLGLIQRRLKQVDIEKEQRKMLDIAKTRVEEPVRIANIKRTEKAQSFTYDPSYVTEGDIFMPNGMLLYPAGTSVNPLDHITLDTKLIFIDGKDPLQIAWFKERESSLSASKQDKLILIAGRPLDLQKRLGREVYFDQAGILTTKFNIEQVPAIVEQEGKILRIREVKIEND